MLKKATNEEGNYITRKFGTRFSDLGRIKDDYRIVLSGVREDKEEYVPPSGPGLSYRYNMTTWLRYRSAIYVPYGINYIAKSNPCTILDVPEVIQIVNRGLPPSPHNRRTSGGGNKLTTALRLHSWGEGGGFG